MVKKFVKHVLSRKEFRFILVGGVNTVVGYGFYALFVFMNMHYMAANVAAYIIGVINSYILNKFFTFKTKSRAVSELGRFILVYVLAFALGSAFLFILVHVLRCDEYLAGALNVVLVALISYFGHNYYSFRKGDTHVS